MREPRKNKSPACSLAKRDAEKLSNCKPMGEVQIKMRLLKKELGLVAKGGEM